MQTIYSPSHISCFTSLDLPCTAYENWYNFLSQTLQHIPYDQDTQSAAIFSISASNVYLAHLYIFYVK